MKNNILPEKKVIFLGGHPNMTKKLRQIYPKWTFLSDDDYRRKSNLNQEIVFYWTKHSSHSLMESVYSRISEKTEILYVTATNVALLTKQMESTYQLLRGHIGS